MFTRMCWNNFHRTTALRRGNTKCQFADLSEIQDFFFLYRRRSTDGTRTILPSGRGLKNPTRALHRDRALVGGRRFVLVPPVTMLMIIRKLPREHIPGAHGADQTRFRLLLTAMGRGRGVERRQAAEPGSDGSTDRVVVRLGRRFTEGEDTARAGWFREGRRSSASASTWRTGCGFLRR